MKTKKKKFIGSNPARIPARMRHGGPMRDKREKRAKEDKRQPRQDGW